MKSHGERCPDDLFARSRRGPLSLVEQRALDAHLGVCGLCRAAKLLAELSDDLPDDDGPRVDAQVARLASQVAYGWSARRPRFSRIMAFASGMAILAVAGAAAAWVIARRARPAMHEPAGLAAPHDSTVAPTARGHRRPAGLPIAPVELSPPPVAEPAPPPPLVPSPPPVAEPAPPPPLAPSPLPGPRLRRPSGAPVSLPAAALPSPPATAPAALPGPPLDVAATGAPPPVSASVEPPPAGPGPLALDEPARLFAAANAARAANSLREALAGYADLQRRFPGTDEARLSFFSAGDLSMRLGEPAAALVAFDRYLQEWPTGALAAEALFARARCLDALGRRDDAVAAWQRLLRAYPQSIYESAARRRLVELQR